VPAARDTAVVRAGNICANAAFADDAEQDEAAAKSGTGELLAHCRCDVARDAAAHFSSSDTQRSPSAEGGDYHRLKWNNESLG
jgi:hypothetical protein